MYRLHNKKNIPLKINIGPPITPPAIRFQHDCRETRPRRLRSCRVSELIPGRLRPPTVVSTPRGVSRYYVAPTYYVGFAITFQKSCDMMPVRLTDSQHYHVLPS